MFWLPFSRPGRRGWGMRDAEQVAKLGCSPETQLYGFEVFHPVGWVEPCETQRETWQYAEFWAIAPVPCWVSPVRSGRGAWGLG